MTHIACFAWLIMLEVPIVSTQTTLDEIQQYERCVCVCVVRARYGITPRPLSIIALTVIAHRISQSAMLWPGACLVLCYAVSLLQLSALLMMMQNWSHQTVAASILLYLDNLFQSEKFSFCTSITLQIMYQLNLVQGFGLQSVTVNFEHVLQITLEQVELLILRG